MSLVYCAALSHAHFYAIQCKALPNIPSAGEQLSRCVTSCVLMSWAAVEGAVAQRAAQLRDEGKYRPHPSRQLADSVRMMMEANGDALDQEQFKRLREARNHMVHPKADHRDDFASVELALETFQLCANIIQSLYWPDRIVYDASPARPQNGLPHTGALRELRSALVRDQPVDEQIAQYR